MKQYILGKISSVEKVKDCALEYVSFKFDNDSLRLSYQYFSKESLDDIINEYPVGTEIMAEVCYNFNKYGSLEEANLVKISKSFCIKF